MTFSVSKIGRLFVVLALLASIGAHWAVLQSVAWTQMLVERSQGASFVEAVKTTFDGEHPCEMCRRIAEEQQKEKQPELSPLKVKLDGILERRAVVCIPPVRDFIFPTTTGRAESRPIEPALPPPRRA